MLTICSNEVGESTEVYKRKRPIDQCGGSRDLLWRFNPPARSRSSHGPGRGAAVRSGHGRSGQACYHPLSCDADLINETRRRRFSALGVLRRWTRHPRIVRRPPFAPAAVHVTGMEGSSSLVASRIYQPESGRSVQRRPGYSEAVRLALPTMTAGLFLTGDVDDDRCLSPPPCWTAGEAVLILLDGERHDLGRGSAGHVSGSTPGPPLCTLGWQTD